MKRATMSLLAITALAGLALQAEADITLGTAGNFSVLAGSTVTNTGSSVIQGGGVGVSPGSTITGFPPGVVVPPFTLHLADAVAGQAQSDLTTAYNAAAGLAPTQILTGQDLGGLTLAPGVYFFASSAQLTGTLTLNKQGNPNAQFVFRIGSTLTTASNSSVVTINGGGSQGCTVFWQVGSSATLGTGTVFEGHILALTSITMNTGASILGGSALARNGAVTLDTNSITSLCGSGACCDLSTGACTITGSVACGTGSTFVGVGAVCNPNPCVLGACCNTATSACTNVIQSACAGTWRPGVCQPSPCSGACCNAATGTCAFVPASTCAAPGVFQGGVCPPNPCPQIACCNAVTGACQLSVNLVCAPGTGSVAGAITCSPSPCPFPGGTTQCPDCTWPNGAYDGRSGQVSHLGGAVPNGIKAADDFSLCDNFVYDLKTITATLLTTTTPGLVRPKAEIWSDCNGCPAELLYTFDQPLVIETGLDAGPAFDGRPLRIVHVTFDVTRETLVQNQNVVLHGGNYWLSVYGQTDGLGPTTQMYDVTYWGTTGNGIRGLPAKKVAGLPTPSYNQFNFPSGCGTGGWHSVDDCCLGCTDLNFSFCATACKVLIDNGYALAQVGGAVVGSTSQFAGANSLFDTRTADDFVVPPCQDYRVCYLEGCVLTDCLTFDGRFEIYANDCNKPSYSRFGTPLQSGTATKIIDLGYSAVLDGRPRRAYRLEFHDLSFVLAGGRQYWVSIGVAYTFSLIERAYFCYNDDCDRSCLIRWNAGKVLTATSIADGTVNTPGWQTTGHDYSFLIAADGTTAPGPIGSTPTCTADFNRDGIINSQDIFDYLNAWFAGCP